MQELLMDTLVEGVSLLLMSFGSALFTVLGFLGEQGGLTNIIAGDPVLGSWEVFIGTWALFVGIYLLGYKQIAPELRGIVT